MPVDDHDMNAQLPAGREITEAGWQAVRRDGRVRDELIDAAYQEPRLRQLFPWTGMGELHFSRCTEHRWTWDIPYIQPAKGGGYWVSGPLRTESVGPAATAADAIAMVIARLPASTGPAFVGTPEQLAAHETAHGHYPPQTLNDPDREQHSPHDTRGGIPGVPIPEPTITSRPPGPDEGGAVAQRPSVGHAAPPSTALAATLRVL